MIRSADTEAGEQAYGDVAMDIEDLRDLQAVIGRGLSVGMPSERLQTLMEQIDTILEAHYHE